MSKPRHKPDIACKKCGQMMTWEPGDPGEPPTWNCPMGGCPPTNSGWGCDCGEFEPDDDFDGADDDYERDIYAGRDDT